MSAPTSGVSDPYLFHSDPDSGLEMYAYPDPDPERDFTKILRSSWKNLKKSGSGSKRGSRLQKRGSNPDLDLIPCQIV